MIEPWLSFLNYRKDSFAFHDLTVVEVVEQLFSHYAKGVVAPAWRWQLADPSQYQKRSLTCQYNETDFAFVERLLAEEGIFYWFEHTGDTQSPTLGQHVMVLADSNEAFKPDNAANIRFHRGDATEKDDTIQQWQPIRRWQTGQVQRASWDYRTLSTRPAFASVSLQENGTPTVDDDTAGPYAWANRQQGDYRARQQLDALHVRSAQVEGAGGVRTLAPGQSILLSGHATQSASPQAILRVHHNARNNLDADVHGKIEALLGSAFDALLADDDMSAAAPSSTTGKRQASDAEQYHNRFVALPISQPYRPRTADGHGLRRHPKATVMGAQSAIVAGSGGPIYSDRDQRVIVQQHWQRGSQSASRLDHPRQANAPADDSAGTWARVATSVAGANWGSIYTPRVGQEVWLDYLEGDIDRPVIVASLYNGQGNDDAPYNKMAGGPSRATGNAPAWFSGNGHAGVLSGIKTQDLATSGNGTGGYRQLQFDDTPNQGHVQLYTTDYHSGLTLGHVKHLEGNQRQADLGYGVSLATDAQGAIRAGKGLLITTGNSQQQMHAGDVTQVLQNSSALMQGLADVANKQQAGLDDEPSAADLPAIKASSQLQEELNDTADGTPSLPNIGGGDGTVTAWTQPHLVIHGDDGLITVTPKSHIWNSGKNLAISAGQDLNIAAQGEFSAIAADGIALYTQGSDPAAKRAVTDTGLSLHAATGNTRVQAQNDAITLAAAKAVNIASAKGAANLTAKHKIKLAAGSGGILIEGGNITITASGNANFKAAKRSLAAGGGGGASLSVGSGSVEQEAFERAPSLCEFKTRGADAEGAGLVEVG